MNVRCKPLVAAISAALATYSVSTLAAYDIDIVPGSYTTGISGTNPFTSIGPAYLSTNRIIAAMTGGANVSVVTGGAGGLDGTINLIGPIDYTGTGANTLSLRAHEDIILDARIGSFIVNNDPLNLVLTADRDNYLGGSVIINNLVRTSGGMFTASGASIYGAGYLDVGTASLTANDGNIVLDDARNDFTTVSSYGQDVTLRDSNSIVLGTTTTGTSALSPGDLTVTASGNITDSGNLAITGAASFTASLGDIVLGNAAGETANFGRITFASAAVVNISEDSATTLTGINTAGDLTLISAGAITKRTAASLDVANHAVLQGTSISLGSESGLVNFGTVDATTTAGSIRIDEDSGMEIAGLRSDRDATMTAAGSIHSWGGDIAVDGTATFVAAGDIVLDTQTSNFGTLRADASAGNGNIFVREDSAMDIAQVTTAGDGMVRLESMDAINDTDNVGVNIAARTIEVAAVNGIGTTSALQIGNAAHLFLATGGGFNVSVTGELDSLGLVLHPATGSSTYVLTNGGLDDFEMIGTDTGLDVSVTDADGLNLHLETGAAVHLRRIDTGSGGLVVAAAGGITDDIGVEVGGATMLDAAGGDITLDSTGNDFTGAVSVSGRNIALRDANALTLGASTVSGDLTLAAGGTVNQTESVSVAGTMTAASTTDHLDYDLAGNQLHAGQLLNDTNLRMSNGLITGAIENNAALRLTNIQLASTIQNNGDVQVDGTGSVFSGAVVNNGQIDIAGGAVAVFDGMFAGAGGIAGAGSVQFNGAVAPGNSPAEISIAADTIFGSTSTLAIEIGGTQPGTGYDRVTVGGHATLGGTLSLSLIDGFTPVVGDVFDILLADSYSGAFADFLAPALAGMQFELFYGTDFVRVAAVSNVPVPAAAWLFGSGVLSLFGVARRKVA